MFHHSAGKLKKFLVQYGRAGAGIVIFALMLFVSAATSFAQMDQGAITGIVQDSSGAIVPNAQITVTNIDTGLAIQVKTSAGGTYVAQPLKIGNYTVTATAEGFQTTTRENLHVDAQARLGVNLLLQPGSVSQTVTVTDAAPLLETQNGAVGQVISTDVINNTPLNGRNWVYIAQLTAGVAPPFGNTRGSGSGDFVANGQRAEQNNFILDGVDNNTNLVDFLNGSSFVMRPPPDALSEFSLQTSNFSAEFGHSAGAVMNASLKSGTNQIHGSLWEYFRNTNLDALNWNAQTPSPYHQNQFGATLGFPILKNKLFYFGDLEANRISIGQTGIYTVPTALMRQGDFSELLDTSLTGAKSAIQLYQPNSGGTQTLSCNGQNNVFCPGQINAVAQHILSLYPQPNTNGGKLLNNLVENVSKADDTFQWDQRLDWNITSKDQAYARYSYLHEVILNNLPLGPILDGSGYGGERDSNLAENFMLSETHIFTPTLTNEFRFGYNWGVFSFLQPNANNTTLASSLGLGGVPALGANQYGLPLGLLYGSNGVPTANSTCCGGVVSNQWGSVGTSDESQNVYQILDNVSKVIGNHSLKFGVSLQALRFFYRYAPASLGQYSYNGASTENPSNPTLTGYAIADFLADQMNSASIANAPNINDAQWYDSAYAQDDWKVSSKLTLNLGVRYDYYQPYKENSGQQANFIADPSTLGFGTGQAVYQLPNKAKNVDLGSLFLNTLAKDNVTVQYTDNDRLATSQKTNFAPRVGFAYQAQPNTVFRGGFGIFYGGLQSQGNTNLGSNFPFSNSASIPSLNCLPGNCPSLASQGASLETGLVSFTGGGLQNFVNHPGFHAIDPKIKTPYTMNYSFGMQQALSPNLVATVSYVGNASRHLSLYYDPNTTRGLFNPNYNTQPFQPFPDLGGAGTIHFGGVSTYNSLQAKLEKRYSRGLTFLATYTWAHALDDSSDAGGLSSAIGDRNMVLLPFITEFTNSVYDVRNRFTLNGNYELPFGKGRAFVNQAPKVVDELIGGWSSSLTLAMQSGTPFTVSPSNSGPSGGSARAIQVSDPFSGGGGDGCPGKVKTKDHWYNPCAFKDPLSGSLIAPPGVTPGAIDPTTGNPNGYVYSSPVTDTPTVLAMLGGRSNTIYGPGYYATNMSLFKSFPTWHEQSLQFRADAFNVLNHPTWGNPSNTNTSPGAGNITGPKFFQNNTPDARFFQLSLKYLF